MVKTELKNMDIEELYEYIFKDVDINFLDDAYVLRDYGAGLSHNEANLILRRLSQLRYSDIRGHIAISNLANISYSSNNKPSSLLTSILYDEYERTIRTDNVVLKVDEEISIKIFISDSKWIDLFFDKGDIRITMLLVP